MDDVVGSVDEEMWSSSACDLQDASAIDEGKQFGNISAVGYVDEEPEAKPPLPLSPFRVRIGKRGRSGNEMRVTRAFM